MKNCKGKTKKGFLCKNKATNSSSYCNIHRKLNEPYIVDSNKEIINQTDLRKRTIEEDTLLGARTTAFLVSNGFLMTARGVTNNTGAEFAISILGFLIAILWLITSIQSWKVITALHNKYHSLFPNDAINKLVFENILWGESKLIKFLGPTELISLWLPALTIITWVALTILGIVT